VTIVSEPSSGVDPSLASGRAVMDQVYGDGFTAAMPTPEDPLTVDVVRHLFGEIWSRPDLSIRDRRLLVIGATAAAGRADLLEVQIRGAFANGELTEQQVNEAALHLLYYVGVGNAGLVHHAGKLAAGASRSSEGSE
jgi:4-carboxymuconolactone decarboxylase